MVGVGVLHKACFLLEKRSDTCHGHVKRGCSLAKRSVSSEVLLARGTSCWRVLGYPRTHKKEINDYKIITKIADLCSRSPSSISASPSLALSKLSLFLTSSPHTPSTPLLALSPSLLPLFFLLTAPSPAQSTSLSPLSPSAPIVLSAPPL